MNAHTPNIQTSESPAAKWRDLCRRVQACVVTPETPEAKQAAADGISYEDFLHDETFICPVLGHHFLYEDGIETRNGWQCADAAAIGLNDSVFQYGEAV